MSDRELLELAAKAAGIESSIGLLPKDGVSIIQPSGDKWNPLTNDGDALRLAVKLGLSIQVILKYEETQVFLQTGYLLEKHRADPYAATRRAIVKAAAKIGRDMK